MDVNGWTYSGDVNIQHGGYYWRQDPGLSDDHSDSFHIVEVVPYRDLGGPDNLFRIRVGDLTVSRNLETRAEALKVVGVELEDASDQDLVDAFRAQPHTFDADIEYTLRIGPVDTLWSGRGTFPEPCEVIRAGSSLRKHIVREYVFDEPSPAPKP